MNGMKPAETGRSVQSGSSRLPSSTTSPLADQPGGAVHRRQHAGASALAGLERVAPQHADPAHQRAAVGGAGLDRGRAVAPGHAAGRECAIERAELGRVVGRLHDRAAAPRRPSVTSSPRRDPAVGSQHLARGGDEPAGRIPVHPGDRRHADHADAPVVEPELVGIELGVGAPPALGTPGMRERGRAADVRQRLARRPGAQPGAHRTAPPESPASSR